MDSSFFDDAQSFLHDVTDDVSQAQGAYTTIFGSSGGSPSPMQGPTPSGAPLSAAKGMGMFLIIAGGAALLYLLWSARK